MKRMLDPNEIGNRVIRLPLKVYYDEDHYLIFELEEKLASLLNGIDIYKTAFIYVKGIYEGFNPSIPFEGEFRFSPEKVSTDFEGLLSNAQEVWGMDAGDMSTVSLIMNKGETNELYFAVDDQDIHYVYKEAYVEFCLSDIAPGIEIAV